MRPRIGAAGPPAPRIDEPRAWRVEALFAGARPLSIARGLEPAFLLFEREILERVLVRALQLGVPYQTLAAQIMRDHVDRY